MRERKLPTSKAWMLLGVTGALACAHGASATIIEFGTLDPPTQSSDETDPLVLDATMDIDVDGLGTTLTITVTNNTPQDGSGYNINQVYFNSSAGVGLTPLVLPPDWDLLPDQGIDGFGIFDWCLDDGVGNQASTITPGETVSFTMTINPASTKANFLELSSPGQGDKIMLAAMKFVAGPQGDSAFGAVVPSPGALSLLALAGLLCGRRRRRTTS